MASPFLTFRQTVLFTAVLLGLTALPAMAGGPAVPPLETVGAPDASAGVKWSIGSADGKLASLLPEGLRPLWAFRLSTSARRVDPSAQAEAPEITLLAKVDLGPRPGVFVVTRPELQDGSEQIAYW